jgi:hypothetical protein
MKATDCSKSNGFYARASLTLAMTVIWCIATGASSCSSGSGGPAGAPVAQVIGAAIADQPVDQSIPMGLSATFSVTATGSSLQYQWAKNGAAIAGATGSSYTTPPTAFDATGTSFTVTVGNALGMITSNPASLTVTARAPMTGDLRFQQVDAPSTVNGWGTAGVGISTFLLPRGAQYFTPSIGTPFYVGSAGNCGATSVTDGTGCTWAFSAVPFTVSSSNPTLLAGYASDFFDNFEADLQNTAWPAFSNGASPASAASVITSMDLEPANVLFAVSWMQSAQQTGFNLVLNTVTAAKLSAAAAQEGASSRVITAISYNAGEITYLAYGWQADTATLYEAQVATTSPTNAPTAAAGLAAQGFIITATGQADSSGNILLVGTRVQGDTMARPFVAAQGSSAIDSMMQQGYANVAVIVDLSNPANSYTYLGER